MNAGHTRESAPAGPVPVIYRFIGGVFSGGTLESIDVWGGQ